jgi:hypothetical protein
MRKIKLADKDRNRAVWSHKWKRSADRNCSDVSTVERCRLEPARPRYGQATGTNPAPKILDKATHRALS